MKLDETGNRTKEIHLLIIACSNKLLCEETLAGSIKQSTQQRGKGRTKRGYATLGQKSKTKMAHKWAKEQKL